MRKLGTDISHWQGNVSFEKMKDYKIEFVIAKAGEMTDSGPYTDDKYERNRKECKRLGIPFGAYYFFHPKYGASAQGRHFLEIVNSQDEPDFPLVVDVEVTDGKTAEFASSVLYAFILYIEQRGWKKPIIYTRNGFWVNQYGHPNWGEDHLFWIAQYPLTYDITDPFKFTTTPSGLSTGINRIIWQFTEKMTLSGLPKLDGDWWMTTDELFKELTSGAKVENPEEPEEPEEPQDSGYVQVQHCNGIFGKGWLFFRNRPELYDGATMAIGTGVILKLLSTEKVIGDIEYWYVESDGREGYVSAGEAYTKPYKSSIL